jgi:hypothetical protein
VISFVITLECVNVNALRKYLYLFPTSIHYSNIVSLDFKTNPY